MQLLSQAIDQLPVHDSIAELTDNVSIRHVHKTCSSSYQAGINERTLWLHRLTLDLLKQLPARKSIFSCPIIATSEDIGVETNESAVPAILYVFE